MTGGGALPATGARFELPYVKVLEFGPDGLVRLDTQYFDNGELFRQLVAP